MLIDYNYKTYLSGVTFSGITYAFTPPFKNNKGFLYSPPQSSNYTDNAAADGIAILQKVVFMDPDGNDVEFDLEAGLNLGNIGSGSLIDYYAQFMPTSSSAATLRINNLRIGLFETDEPVSIFMPIKYKKMIFTIESTSVEPVTWTKTIKLFTLY
jgi:hypothetical protein